MDKKFSKKTISKDEIYHEIKMNVKTASEYRDEGNMKQALTFAKMAYINFRALCFLGIGFDDNFSKCYDFYAEKTNIGEITDLFNKLTDMLKYNGESI